MDSFEALIRDVRALRVQFAQLADQLTAAAEDLKNSGIPISETLSEDLRATRQSFEVIRGGYLDLSA